MSEQTEIFDAKGKQIVIGSRVKCGDPEFDPGTVTTTTDPEGELNDEGRMVAINPVVYVQWSGVEESDIESISTSYIGSFRHESDPRYECEELEVMSDE